MKKLRALLIKSFNYFTAHHLISKAITELSLRVQNESIILKTSKTQLSRNKQVINPTTCTTIYLLEETTSFTITGIPI